MDARQYVAQIAESARSAAAALAASSGQQRDQALRACAEALRDSAADIRAANEKDRARSEEFGLSPAMVKRLTLTEDRLEKMASALEQIARQSDPVGRTLSAHTRPNGLRVEKRAVPIGVVGFIYESRPNVTSDAAGLCIKSGNAIILRGGKEAVHSNQAIAPVLHEGLGAAGLPEAAVTVVDRTDREVVPAMAQAEGLIDVMIARGGEGLIRAVTEVATVPVLKHYAGNCHVYVHAGADESMAEAITLNAKCQYPAVCNAAETLLVDEAVAESFLPRVARRLIDHDVELRCGPRALELLQRAATEPGAIIEASEGDWTTEFLDRILAVKVVGGLEDAIEHINAYGSHHTDAIVTRDIAAADRFVTAVDSASVMVNASTRFSDGGEYGLGAEIGISTDRFHARGPMGAEDMTTYKWIVTGRGHLRQ